ncbi:hypothetical protein B0H16DRAFT_1826416 [Mycena metata]|uniref:C2H2-type domain-containing protein n=1 Tax=Mycena metata TaxID=1033252 RepID=A0AAD7M8L9_9AGAR|nr:hypothetical protein B0H16DRAFT_1826416 [Mycena metata]
MVFNSRNALREHYKRGRHPFCVLCHKDCRDDAELDAHNASVHSRFTCTICRGKTFGTQSSLDDHYRGKPAAIHPNCDRCGKGFLNDSGLNDHVLVDHPKSKCCYGTIFDDDLPLHYRESVNHPKCLTCGIGFKDDKLHRAHATAEHGDLHCTICQRQFATRTHLAEHFKTADVHPLCAPCGMGFLDDAAFIEHLSAAEHIIVRCLHSALGSALKHLLPTNEVPGRTRPLPPPSDWVRHFWTSTTQNQVIPTLQTVPVMINEQMASIKAFCEPEIYHNSGPTSVGGQVLGPGVLGPATKSLQTHNVLRRESTSPEGQTNAPQVDRLKSWTSLNDSVPWTSVIGSNTTHLPHTSSSWLVELSEGFSGSDSRWSLTGSTSYDSLGGAFF